MKRSLFWYLKSTTKFILLSCAIFQTNEIALAYEGLSKNPGTRAMGMAGVFSAQSDDSSAIWYNPGAIALYKYISSDITIELGQRPISGENIDSLNDNIYENSDSETTLNFLAAYTRNIPFIKNNKYVGIGFSYFSPYNLQINVNAAINALSEIPYGYINAKYHQFSSLISARAHNKLSIGATFDFIWIDIECLEFQPCVQTGPTAIGVKFGALYEAIRTKELTLKISALWQSEAETQYFSKPNSGIGSILNEYLPNRPNMFGIGASLQKPTPWMLITSNVIYESVNWSSSINKGKQLTDYHNIGVSFELMTNVKSGNSFGLRVGSKLMQSKESISSDVLINAIGLGYEIKRRHIIDVAIENRRVNGIDENSNYVTLSYAWQKTK